MKMRTTNLSNSGKFSLDVSATDEEKHLFMNVPEYGPHEDVGDDPWAGSTNSIPSTTKSTGDAARNIGSTIAIDNPPRTDSKNQKKNKRIAKINRANKRAAAVTKSLLKSAGEIAGAKDAKKEAEIDEIDDFLSSEAGKLVVNPWALDLGATKYSYATIKEAIWVINELPEFTAVDSNGNAGVHISGLFKLMSGQEVYIDQPLPYHNGEPLISATKCGTVFLVERTTGYKPQLVDINIRGDASTRLRAIVPTCLLKCDWTKSFDNAYLAMKLKNYYLTYNQNYASLDNDLAEIMTSDWFHDQVLNWHTRAHQLWSKRLKMRIQAKYNALGLNRDVDNEIDKKLYHILNLTLMKLKIPRLSTVARVPAMSWWNAVVYSLGAGLTICLGGFGGLAAGAVLSVCLTQLEDRYTVEKAIEELHNEVFNQSIAKVDIGVVPCSKLFIRKMNIGSDRLTGDLMPNFNLETDYIVEDDDLKEETVDIYGSTIPCSMVYPKSSDKNLDGAMRLRMGFHRDIDNAATGDFIKFAKDWIDNNMPVLELKPVSEEENNNYLVKKYGKSVGETLIKQVDKPLQRKHLVYNAFVKKEVYLGKSASNFKPRMIWSSPGIIIAKYSLYFNQISKHFNELFSSDGDVMYASSTTPYEVGRFAEKMVLNRAHLYESDVSSWDGSLSSKMLSLEKYYIETKVRGLPVDFKVLLDHWGYNKATSSTGGVKATLDYGRRSGDLWTSSFNSLINILITKYLYGEKAMIMVLGDDNLVSCDGDLDTTDLEKRYAQLGMKCEIVKRSCLEDAGFCSGRFWKVNDTYKWGNCPFRTLAKFGFNHNKHHEKVFKGLLYGTAKSLLPSGGHVPILGAFLRAIVASAEGKNVRAKYDLRDENPYKIGGGQIDMSDEDTYSQFEDLYTMSREEIDVVENWFAANIDIDDFPYLMEGPKFVDGYEKDCGASDRCEEIYFEHLSPEVNHALNVYDRIVYEEPFNEEVLKLRGVRNVYEAARSGWEFGAEEDKMLGTNSHAYLHALFSSVSYFNLDWGVSLHSRYNAWALEKGKPPCARKKKKGNGMKELIKGAVKSGLIAAGAGIGTSLGGPTGGIIGSKAGALISKLVGAGDYKVKSNTIMTSGYTFGQDSREIRVRHHEYLGDIVASSGFNVKSVMINPGLPGLFTWVAQLADAFQQYSMKGCVFYYRSTSAEWNGVGQSLGTVIMGTNYDVTRPNFTSKIEMENYMFSNSTKPSEHSMHPIECDRTQTPISELYLRSGPLGADQDPKFYDFANFQIAVVGCDPAVEGQPIGELWVAYDVAFLKPQYPPGGVIPGQYFSYVASAVDATNVLGTIIGTTYGNLPVTVGATGGAVKRINFPNTISGGRFLVVVTWKVAVGGTFTRPTAPTLSNATLVTWWASSGTVTRNDTWIAPANGITTNDAQQSFVMTINGYDPDGSYVDINVAAKPIIGTCSAQVDIVAIPTINIY